MCKPLQLSLHRMYTMDVHCSLDDMLKMDFVVALTNENDALSPPIYKNKLIKLIPKYRGTKGKSFEGNTHLTHHLDHVLHDYVVPN